LNEWLAVAVAGAVGGFASTFLPPGTDVPWPRAIQTFIGHHSNFGLGCYLIRNVCLGALAGFVVWGLSVPDSNFSSHDVRVGQIAAAVIIGGGGVSAMNRLFQQAGRLEERDRGLAIAESLLEADTGDGNGESNS
jgi:hypothetical protein